MEKIETPAGTGETFAWTSNQLYPELAKGGNPNKEDIGIAGGVEDKIAGDTGSRPETSSPGFHIPKNSCHDEKNRGGNSSGNEETKAGKSGNDGSASADQLRQKEMLISVVANVVFWHDPDGEAFATIEKGGGRLNVRVRSRDLSEYLCHRCYKDYGIVPSKPALEEVTRTLEGRAKYEGKEFETHVRVAGDASTSYIHLADPGGTIVRIDASGVKTLDASDGTDARIPTLRYLVRPGMRPLPVPLLPQNINEAREKLEVLREFCNIPDQGEWKLFLVTLLSALRPHGPFVVMFVVGEQGSAKSTLCKLFRCLVDPSKVPLRSAPKDERDLWIAASNGWLVIFDNVSSLSLPMSDAICRLSTGGGNSYRKLYENSEEMLFQAQRPVLINTIADLRLRGDLVDRGIRLTCAKIDETKRRPEAEFWKAFDQEKAKLFGALTFVLSAAQKELPTVDPEKAPRMADYARFGMAVEKALGWNPDSFLKAYETNRDALSSASQESQLTELVKVLPLPLEKTPTELWTKLAKSVDLAMERLPRWFPANPQQLSSELRRLTPYFRQRGFEIEFSKNGTRQISIKRLDNAEMGKDAPDASHASKPGQN